MRKGTPPKLLLVNTAQKKKMLPTTPGLDWSIKLDITHPPKKKTSIIKPYIFPPVNKTLNKMVTYSGTYTDHLYILYLNKFLTSSSKHFLIDDHLWRLTTR